MGRRALYATLAVLPAVAASLFFLAGDVPRFFDPCHTWGGGGSISMAPDDPCRARSASSETAEEALVRILLVHGFILGGSAVAWWGLAWGRGAPTAAGAWLLALVSVPLMLGFAGYPIILTSALVLAAGGASRVFTGGSLWAARALALVVSALFLLRLVSAFASGIRPFVASSLVLLVVPVLMLAGVALASRRS